MPGFGKSGTSYTHARTRSCSLVMSGSGERALSSKRHGGWDLASFAVMKRQNQDQPCVGVIRLALLFEWRMLFCSCTSPSSRRTDRAHHLESQHSDAPRTFSSSFYFVAGSFEHRSEEHTSELQSRGQLVCRLLLEKNTYG